MQKFHPGRARNAAYSPQLPPMISVNANRVEYILLSSASLDAAKPCAALTIPVVTAVATLVPYTAYQVPGPNTNVSKTQVSVYVAAIAETSGVPR